MSTFTAVLHKEDDLYVAEYLKRVRYIQGRIMNDAVSSHSEVTEVYHEEFPQAEK
jgi:hypothetical protein